MTNNSHRFPPWETADPSQPKPLSWRNWASFIGPSIVMIGSQIGGGEWLLGPTVTAKFGGGLMWIATVAIVLQVFYNLECGRYALYCGEPVFTGFMRMRPGPMFWVVVMLTLNISTIPTLVPGPSTHGAADCVAHPRSTAYTSGSRANHCTCLGMLDSLPVVGRRTPSWFLQIISCI
ncbi:MAG TPA: Nramp family divalent metal transporter [Pirellula sp.]|nr:Nramp family divalent metal transporter [Pirellula sp.]